MLKSVMFGMRKHDFSPLSVEEDDPFGPDGTTRPAKKGAKSWRSFLTCGGLLLILCFIATWALSVGFGNSASRWSSCGDSVETAHQRGCSFDLISYAWQTPECYDGDLVAEFASWEGNWSFFADDKFTVSVSQEMAMRGDQSPLFVRWDYHIVHCTFMWRQMHRAYERGWIDDHLGNYNHTLHCQHMLLMDSNATEHAVTVAQLRFPGCNRAGHSEGRHPYGRRGIGIECCGRH